MSEFTDQDIPISCGECGVYVEGLEDMIKHILETHKNYNALEARVYAAYWLESAYEEVDLQNEALRAYYKRR